MCGIAGVLNFNRISVDEAEIRKMMEAQKHRGPDDEGVFIFNQVGFGFNRLSIIDLSLAGHQPFQSEDERFTLIFNGEIYNYLELKEELILLGNSFKTNADTEVLLKAYMQWGESCFDKFIGMWALAIYDKDENSVFLSRDRFGIKPLYYYQESQSFYFASEIPAILSLKKSKNEANFSNIFDYLIFNKTEHNEDTFFQGIKKLRHGHSLKINLNEEKIVTKNWYNISENVDQNSGFSSIEEYKEALERSVELHLRSDVPLGVSFSGGIDSSAIVSLISQQKNQKVNTFSAVYDKEFDGDETEFIKEYAKEEQSFTYPSAEKLLEEMDEFLLCQAEPIPSTSPFAQFLIMKDASKKVVVMLDGQGADEQLGGYHYFFGFYFKDLLLKFKFYSFFKEIFFYLKIHKSIFGIKSLFFFLLPNKLRTRYKISESGHYSPEFIQVNSNKSSISNDLYSSKNFKESLLNHFEFKLEHLLKWEDRNSMHFSLEARVPFLNHILVEKTLATNPRLIIKKGNTKFILRESMKGIIPEKIRTRNDKIGFETPQDEWFRTKEWQLKIWEILSSESFKTRSIFNVEKLKTQYQKHLDKKINISREIWKWINLELWFRKFID